MDEPAVVAQGHVGAGENVGGDGLAEDLDAQSVGDDLLGFALEVRMNEGDVVVGADNVTEGGEAFFNPLDGDGRGKGVADVGEFLVGGGGGEEEAFAVAGLRIWELVDWVKMGTGRHDRAGLTETYPAVNLPTILVPAMVA
jgi:hypothetical protein